MSNVSCHHHVISSIVIYGVKLRAFSLKGFQLFPISHFSMENVPCLLCCWVSKWISADGYNNTYHFIHIKNCCSRIERIYVLNPFSRFTLWLSLKIHRFPFTIFIWLLLDVAMMPLFKIFCCIYRKILLPWVAHLPLNIGMKGEIKTLVIVCSSEENEDVYGEWSSKLDESCFGS